MKYTIWIENEHYVDFDLKDSDDDYCNVEIIFSNGDRKAYNIWTEGFFGENLSAILDEIHKNGFVIMPDLIVQSLERSHIEKVIGDLVGGNVED
jgi:hypothetical protein